MFRLLDLPDTALAAIVAALPPRRLLRKEPSDRDALRAACKRTCAVVNACATKVRERHASCQPRALCC